MTATKVSSIIDIEKLKEEKKLTACKCQVDGCGNIGKWDNRLLRFCLINFLCYKHYQRYLKTRDAQTVKRVYDKDRVKNPLYDTYYGIKQRCYNENTKAYKNYGGRGIKMSDEWLNDFNVFFSDMGQKPTPHHSIERNDVNGNYCKENCRWATPHEQAANTRRSNKNVGVYFDKTEKRWIGYLEANGKVYRKRFTIEQDAIVYRLFLEIKYLGKPIKSLE